jgi:Na+/melibiose symporter-like transporter
MLWLVSGKNKENAESKQNRAEADRIFKALVSPDAFKPTLEFNTGAVSSVLALAGALTLIVGLGLIWLYRRAINRLMHAAASKSNADSQALEKVKRKTQSQDKRLGLSLLTIQSAHKKAPFKSVQLAKADRAFRITAFSFVCGALTFSVIAAVLTIFFC